MKTKFIIYLFFLVAVLFPSTTVYSQILSNSGAVMNITSATEISKGGIVNTSGTINNAGIITLDGSLTNAGTISGNGNYTMGGNWTNNGTFTPGTSTVNFNGSVAQTISGSGTKVFNNLSLNNTAGAGITSGNYSLTGNMINNGIFTSGTSAITFNGSSAQTMSGTGTATFNDLIVNNTNGVSISSGTYSLTDVLTLSNGTFNVSGATNFTMVSDATKTARIAPVAVTAGVAGNFTIQKYIPGRASVTWTDLSSPVVGSTMADWDNELYFTYPHSPPSIVSNVVGYNEVIADYYGVSAATVLTPGKGFEIYLSNDSSFSTFTAKTLTTIGVPNTGNVVVPVTYTAANGPAYLSAPATAYSGENLIGNPYASTVNMSLLTFSPEVSSLAVDVFDNASQAYLTLTGGALIGPHQGFWAYTKAGSPSGTITFTESAKSTDMVQGIRYADGVEPFLQLTIGSSNGTNTFAHTLKVACDPSASDGWDGKDFPYLPSPNTLTPSITSNAGTQLLSISTFSSIHPYHTMALYTTVGSAGSYQISFKGVDFVDTYYPCIILEDLLLHQFVDVHSVSNYVFLANPTDNSARFVLHFSTNTASCTALTTGIQPTTNFSDHIQVLQNEGGNTINFNFAESVPAKITLTNILGQDITDGISIEAYNQSLNIDVPSDFHGVYIIKIASAKGSFIKKFVKF